jgi:hypothetical protein
MFGWRFFEVELIYPRKKPDGEGKSYWHWAAIDCCGKQIVDTTGIGRDRPAQR